jgi:antitoxin CptB
MQELDLLLMRYLDRHWATATPGERATFESFLELPDPVIAGYLLGREEAPDARTQGLVEALRKAPGPAVAPAVDRAS